MKQTTPIYPIGVQSFQKLREGNAIYVDKTRFVWKLANQMAPVFLSRPRRFGKSLMLSTLEAYFLGKKELFEGLEIYELEKNWEVYPVFHIDLNIGEYKTLEDLRISLSFSLDTIARDYDFKDIRTDEPYQRFISFIDQAISSIKKPVVILIDEYDKPLLECPDTLKKDYEDTLRSFYSVLKTYDKKIRFAMLTGVARFGKVSVFSALNNLNDISLDEDFNSICGISQSELEEYFKVPIQELAKRHRLSEEECMAKLKKYYDGYHFSDPEFTEDIYNPFSLLNCFYKRRFGEFWFDTATPRYLIKALMKTGLNYSDLHGIKADENVLVGVNVPENSAASILYQTGYLTIKGYDPAFGRYILDFPNEEVRNGFTKVTFIIYGSKDPNEFDIASFIRDLSQGNPGGFMRRLKSLVAKNPYEHAEHFEAVYHNILFVLFTLLGYQTESECHFNKGRADLIVKTGGYVYKFEFKLDKSAGEALCQIANRGYAVPFESETRKVFKVGVNFSSEARNITDWTIEAT